MTDPDQQAKPTVPVVGESYTYTHKQGQGYGQMAAGGTISAEMTEIDMTNGTVVIVEDMDESTGWPVVSWTDGVGIGRMTTVDLAIFEQYFF
jgi:hypothetical protein